MSIGIINLSITKKSGDGVAMGLKEIEEKVYSGERLTFDDGVTLYNSDDLIAVGRMANTVRERKNGRIAYFIQNLHINPTNLCKNDCQFCAFGKKTGDPDSYSMTVDEVLEKAESVENGSVSEFHIVSGLHPDLPFKYYMDIVCSLKKRFPAVHIQAFTAVEIAYFAEIAELSVIEVLDNLKNAGLGSLPGGGAEIFSARVRKRVCPEKISGREWLDVMESAHNLGIRSNATMLYGHIESIEERVEHLIKLRDLQDRTGGFLTFIPLAFHPENTDLSSLAKSSGVLDLKSIAVSRLMLDNFPHIKAFWIMTGLKIAQIALSFGADDIDGTIMEEKITHAAGGQTEQSVTREELLRLIRDAGRIPVERDTLYNVLKVEEA